LKVADENSRILIRIRIHLHPHPDPLVIGTVWICGSGSVQKFHGSATLLLSYSYEQGTAASNDRHWEQKNSTEGDRREEEVIFLAGGSSTTDDDLSLRLQGLNRGEEEGEGEEVTVLEKEGQEVIHLDQEEEEVRSFLCFI
jgi:hypothetical protein